LNLAASIHFPLTIHSELNDKLKPSLAIFQN